MTRVPTQVIFGEDARKKLAEGINAVADAVKVSRGNWMLLLAHSKP